MRVHHIHVGAQLRTGVTDALLHTVKFLDAALNIRSVGVLHRVHHVRQSLEETHAYLVALVIVAHQANKDVRARDIQIHLPVVAHRHQHTALVTLVDHPSLGVLPKGLLGNARAGKQIIAIGVLGVGHAQDLLSELDHLE